MSHYTRVTESLMSSCLPLRKVLRREENTIKSRCTEKNSGLRSRRDAQSMEGQGRHTRELLEIEKVRRKRKQGREVRMTE